eukprot:TRINITY_DN12816_c0_g1_i1.p1 TRINITY_DN12816_c0_g1~~TRINITY_DN12816_c0_g1_i1.p1  ORF type:complete len:357 (+),score=104.61 TRINITY_DN12816_c0_g1_i1:247-1317(+)
MSTTPLEEFLSIKPLLQLKLEDFLVDYPEEEDSLDDVFYPVPLDHKSLSIFQLVPHRLIQPKINEEWFLEMKKQRLEEKAREETEKREKRRKRKWSPPSAVPSFISVTEQKPAPTGKKQPEKSSSFDSIEPPSIKKKSKSSKSSSPHAVATPLVTTADVSSSDLIKIESKQIPTSVSPEVAKEDPQEKIDESGEPFQAFLTTSFLEYDSRKERESEQDEEVFETANKRQKIGPTEGILSSPPLHELWLKISREDVIKAFISRRDMRRSGFDLCKKKSRAVREEMLVRAQNIAEISRQAPMRSKKVMKKVMDHLRKTESKVAEQRRKKVEVEREKVRQEKKIELSHHTYGVVQPFHV